MRLLIYGAGVIGSLYAVLLRKAILITNNDRVYDKYKDKLACIYTKDYEDTLIEISMRQKTYWQKD